MLQYKEFSAWIVIEGEEAQEFNVEASEDEKKVSCWIPSEVGKKFKVLWKDTAASTATKGKVYVDGTLCQGLVSEEPATNLCSEGFRLSATEIRPYTFSEMDVTDDDALLGSALQGGMGGIELVINRVRVDRLDSTYGERQPPMQQKVHERSKKGLDHQVQFGETVESKAVYSKTLTIGGPVVTFSFKYRPIDVLRANGIAPQLQKGKRKASNVPEDDEGIDVKPERDEPNPGPSDEESDSEEVKELKAKLAAALEAQNSKRPKKKVKKEEMKREKIVGEFIDLT